MSTSTSRQHWWSLGLLALGLAMIVLDGTIVGVALPSIVADLHLDLTQAQWVTSLYSVVFAALLLACGRLADRWGRRTLFVGGVGVFVAGSLVAAYASDAGSLVAARALQGVGGAMVLPASLSTVNATFRGRDRAVAFGVWGAVMAGAAAVGPLLGGWLTQSFGWRAVFWVNVPLGLLVAAGAVLVVVDTRGSDFARGADVDGFLTSSLGFGLIVFGLIEGHQLGWWRPVQPLTVAGWTWPVSAPVSPVPVALAAGLTLVILFVVWERHRARAARSAILDLHLFSVPTFAWGNLTAGAVAAGEFALMFVLPLYLVDAVGLGVLQAGVVLAALALGAFVAGAQARHLSARLGAPDVVVGGLALEVVGAVALTGLVALQVSPWWLVLPLLTYGVGLGLASAQLTSLVLADVPTEHSGTGSATQSTVRQLGSALGSALAGTALGAALAWTLPSALAQVDNLPTTVADHLTTATSSSAGSNLVALRAGGPGSPVDPQVIDALASGFADATAAAVVLAVVLLTAGLVGALRVRRAAAVAG